MTSNSLSSNSLFPTSTSCSIKRHCCLFSTLVSIFVFCGLCALLIVFLVKLNDAKINRNVLDGFNLPTFRVDSGSLNSLNVSSNQLTAEFSLLVSVNNPTTYSHVYYDAVSAEIFYRGEGLILTKSSLPSFSTTSHRKSMIQVTLYVNKPFDFGGAGNGIALNRKDGTVEFGLVLSSLIKYKNNMCDSGWKSLKVVCNPLKFGVSPKGFVGRFNLHQQLVNYINLLIS